MTCQFTVEQLSPQRCSWRFLVWISETKFRAGHEQLRINCDFSHVSRPPDTNTWQRVVIDAAIDLIHEMFGVEVALAFNDSGTLSISDHKGAFDRLSPKHPGFELFCLDSRLRVIPLAPQLDKALHERPFACVVSQSPGERMYNTTKPCLHVFCCEDNEPDFADGLYASHKETFFVGGPITWPVLSAALSKEIKAYSKSLMPKQGELPFQRVMLWQEYGGHTNPPLPEDAEGHALLAFKVAQKWNGWINDAHAASVNKGGRNWGFDDALKSVVSREEWATIVAKEREAKEGDAFRKWCEEIGLVKPHLTDFTTPYNQLLGVLRTALLLHEGVRDKWARDGRP